jgi:hypothetical protein
MFSVTVPIMISQDSGLIQEPSAVLVLFTPPHWLGRCLWAVKLVVSIQDSSWLLVEGGTESRSASCFVVNQQNTRNLSLF